MNKTLEDDVEEDILEAGARKKRGYNDEDITPHDPDDITSYDPTIETNHYESKGTYTVEMVGEKRRLLHLRRSSAGTDLSEAVENSLLAFINHSMLL